MRVPCSTYRLQISEEFTLHHAADIVPYLARLGISDLYLSPIFEARPGSTHGYDVTDPTRIREAVGGLDALRALSAEVQRHDMGILLDIVPNHMAASSHNPWWRDVLEQGRRSQHARFFDVDWGSDDEPRKLRLPILGSSLDTALERNEIDIDVDSCEAVYFETRLPLAAGSLYDDAAALHGPGRSDAIRRILERQSYELVFWRTASTEMSYRRFFDITDLAGVRVEDDHVFAATHSLIRDLAADGVITGLRIDHIDGLRDPAAYLARLRERVRGPGGEPVYTVVEKILERSESLPDDWACEGTTGYEFLSFSTGLLIDAAGHERLEAFYYRVTGDNRTFEELVREKKLLVMERLFGGERTALARSLSQLTRLDVDRAQRCIEELTASLGVYRTYTRSRRVREADRQRIEAALADAAARNPGLAADLDRLKRIVLLQDAPVTDAVLDWVMRWQQFTGPVMAKGHEDTALYCHNALLAANDVGTDPVRPSLTTADLQRALARRRAYSPRSLNTTATHDTKRGEDTRARIAVLSEVPDEWRTRLRRWIRTGDEWKAEIAEEDDTVVPDADVDSLLYQTLLGTWPLTGADETYTNRIKEYMTKAVREAKEQTSWRRPDEDYEQAVHTFVDRLMEEFGRAAVIEDVAEFADRLAPHGALNSLAQLLLKVTAPGVPDTYQGTELWSYTLVDPDNRRAVDYEARRQLLDELTPVVEQPTAAAAAALLDTWQDGRIKLLFTTLALRLRSRRPDMFEQGDVLSLAAVGSAADQVVAYARVLDSAACVVLLPRGTMHLAAAGTPPVRDAWANTTVSLPPALDRAWLNVLTGETLQPVHGSFELSRVFTAVPFALLESI
jgi:(1->4)-alpha-D-glucan 1-alpha-D-glucosylmutase